MGKRSQTTKYKKRHKKEKQNRKQTQLLAEKQTIFDQRTPVKPISAARAAFAELEEKP